MDNALASCSARSTPEHRLSPRSVATLHAVARRSRVVLRHQPDVCHGGYADSGDASDGRDDLEPVVKFELGRGVSTWVCAGGRRLQVGYCHVVRVEGHVSRE